MQPETVCMLFFCVKKLNTEKVDVVNEQLFSPSLYERRRNDKNMVEMDNSY